jgi:hypothetical protein
VTEPLRWAGLRAYWEVACSSSSSTYTPSEHREQEDANRAHILMMSLDDVLATIWTGRHAERVLHAIVAFSVPGAYAYGAVIRRKAPRTQTA